MANVTPIVVQQEIASYLARGMSLRQIQRITGVHRDTVMRMRREPFTNNPTPYPKKEKEFTGLALSVKPRREPSEWKKIALQIEGLPIDGELFLPDFPRESEAARAKLSVNLRVHTLARFSIRSQPTGGIKIIRTGTYASLLRGIEGRYTATANPILIYPGKQETVWEEVREGDCLIAPTLGLASKMRHRALSNPDPWHLTRDMTCGNWLCYETNHIFLRKRRRRVGKPSNELGTGFFLGFMSGTSKADIALQEVQRCSIRGCAFPSNADTGLCHTHRYYFDVEGFEGVIDVNDMFADDNGGDAAYTVGMMWEERYNWLNVKKEGAPGKSAAERQNDAWWHENVIKAGLEVDGVITPKIRGSVLPDVLGRVNSVKVETLQPGVGAQTSLHGKMRRHDKKKIRKTQRKRPAGWVGSRPDHDPFRFSRESIKAMDYDDFPELPTMSTEGIDGVGTI